MTAMSASVSVSTRYRMLALICLDLVARPEPTLLVEVITIITSRALAILPILAHPSLVERHRLPLLLDLSLCLALLRALRPPASALLHLWLEAGHIWHPWCIER